MKPITYEEIAKLYTDLGITDQSTERAEFETSYKQITNRNFGTKDYTISSNSSEYIFDYSKCSI